jgi:hypothetical protein
MPGQHPRPESGIKKRPPKALTEFFRLLEQIRPGEKASRLQLDMAKDAATEVFGKLLRQSERLLQRLARARDRRNAIHARLLSVLQDLATGPVRMPRPAGLPPITHEQLEVTFRELADKDYPAVARTLHAAIGKSDTLAYERFLVEEVFLKASIILVEHLVRRAGHPWPTDAELRFLEGLRHHVAGSVNQNLARQTGYLVTLEVGGELDKLLEKTLQLLFDLQTSDPPGRLLVPALASDFDPARHEAIAGRPSTGALIVRATIFPGYIILSDPPRVVVKAKVFTKRVNGQTGPEDSTPGMPR